MTRGGWPLPSFFSGEISGFCCCSFFFLAACFVVDECNLIDDHQGGREEKKVNTNALFCHPLPWRSVLVIPSFLCDLLLHSRATFPSIFVANFLSKNRHPPKCSNKSIISALISMKYFVIDSPWWAQHFIFWCQVYRTTRSAARWRKTPGRTYAILRHHAVFSHLRPNGWSDRFALKKTCQVSFTGYPIMYNLVDYALNLINVPLLKKKTTKFAPQSINTSSAPLRIFTTL